jgi:hypothetical protein
MSEVVITSSKIFDNDKWTPVRQYAVMGNRPESWLDSAFELNLAAKVLREKVEENWHSQKPFKECFLSPYYMLIGYMIEALLKGILVAKGHNCVVNSKFVGFGVNGHDLIALANKAELSFSKEEGNLLKMLTEHTTWAGRYPIATKWENTYLTNEDDIVDTTIIYSNLDLHQFDILRYRFNKILEESIEKLQCKLLR